MGARVLILEDDVSLASEMKAALTRIGCAVEVLRDGNAGLARASSNRFGLIVASVELPGMNGFRIANRMKKDPRLKPTPLFLTSAEASVDFDAHRRLPTHAESYFHKPFVMAELVARARACVPELGDPGDGVSANAEDPGDDEWIDVADDALNAEEPKTIDLGRELDEVRSVAARDSAAHAEVVARLEREVASWKARAQMPSRSSGTMPATGASEELSLRGQLVSKDATLARLREELDQARHAQRELREKAARLEADIPILKQSLAELGRQNAEMEKLLSSARADKEQAARRALDLSRRLERVRPDIEQAEQALAREQAERRSEAAEHARALQEAIREREARNREDERTFAADLATRDAANAGQIAELVARHDAAVRTLENELTDLRTAFERARAAAAEAEQAHREELLRETRDLRAEHIDALAVAEHGFEHRQAVLRHEFEATRAALEEQAHKRVQEAQALLAEGTREAAQRAHALERALAAAEEARAELLAEHATVLANASGERDRESQEARAREETVREQAVEAVSALGRRHAEELRRQELEHEGALAALRRELADADTRRETERRTAEETLDVAAREHAAAQANLIDEHERVVAMLEALHQERLATARAESDEAVRQAAAQAEERVQAATATLAAHEREIDETRERLETALAEARDALQIEREARSADAATYADRLADVVHASHAELAQHLDRHRAEQEKREGEVRQNLAEEQARELAAERRAHENQLATVERRIEEIRSDHEAELRVRLNESEARHARVLADLEQRALQEVAAAQRALDESMQSVELVANERVHQLAEEHRSRVQALEAAAATVERDRAREMEAARELRATTDALELERTALKTEIASQQASIVALIETHRMALDEARQRIGELEIAQASALEARGAAAHDDLVRARANYEQVILTLQQRVDDARQEAEMRQRATELAQAEALAGAERNFESRVSQVIRQKEDEMAAARAKLAHEVIDLESALATSQGDVQRAAREIEALEAGRHTSDRLKDETIAQLTAALEQERRHHEDRLVERTTQLEARISQLDRRNQTALAAEVDRIRREAKREAQAQFEQQIGRAMEELRIELEMDRAQTFAQMERAHAAALRRVMENGDRERSALADRARELERLLASRAVYEDPADQGARDADLSASIERLEALVQSRVEDVAELRRELDEARVELPGLQGEVAALRTELTSMRLSQDAALAGTVTYIASEISRMAFSQGAAAPPADEPAQEREREPRHEERT